MSTDIVKVTFDGDTLEGIRRNESVWVVVKRVCEALGVDDEDQRKKLQASGWATPTVITAVAADGKNRAVTCLELDQLPMWLATIQVSRVRPELREKLIRYQRECGRVLRDHFLGKPEAAQFDPTHIRALLAEHIDPLTHAIAQYRSEMADVKAENARLYSVIHEIRGGSVAIATSTELELIAALVGDLSELRRRAGSPLWRAMHVRQELAKVARWGGAPGQRADSMPSDAVPYAKGWLELEISRLERTERETEKVREQSRRLERGSRQQAIDFSKPN